MQHTRFRKIWRDLMARRVRTALVSTSIFIGVFGVVTLFSMGNILIARLEETIDKNALSMTQAYVTLADPSTQDDAATLAALTAIPEVTAVQGHSRNTFYWRKDAAAEVETAYLFSYSTPFEAMPIEPIDLVAGRFPVAAAQEIAVERRLASLHGIEVGDSILVQVLSDPSRREEAWTVVGTVYQPYQYVQAPGSPLIIPGDQMLYAAQGDAAYLSGVAGYGVFQLRFSDFPTAQAQTALLEKTLAEQTPYRAYYTVEDNPEQNAFITQVESFRGVLSILALVALIIAGFLVFNIVNSVILEQRQQIGIIKSLGGTWADLLQIYLGTSFIYGLLGVIPGVMLGIPFGFIAVQSLTDQFGIFIDRFMYSPPAILSGIVLGLLVPVLATVPPVLQALRIKILEAITDLGIKASFRQGVLSQLLDAFPLPVGLRQALRSLLSKTGRLALTTFTLSLAAGAFMAVFALINSLNSVTDNIFNTFGNDITIAPSGFAGPEAMQSVQTVEGVADISPASILAVEIIGYTPVGVGAAPASLGAFGVDTSNPAMVNYQLRSGRAWYDDPDKGGVVISNGIADSLGKDTGDSLRVRAGANTQDFEIVGVTQYPFPTIWFPWQALSRMGGLEFGGQAIPNVYSVILSNPDMTAEEVDDLIGRINEQLLAQNVNANYTNWVSTNEYVAQLISTSAALLNIAAALIGAVGAIGLLSTLSMSVFERQKEIGVMRSIGANSLNVAVQFLIEGWLVGLIAWLLGLPISYFLNGVLTETFNFGEGAGISYPPETVLFGLGLMFILTTIASLSPAMAAARKTVSDILRYQ